MKQHIIYRLIYLFSFIFPFTVSAQNTKTHPVNIPVLIQSITDSLKKHYVFSEKAESIAIYLKSQLEKKAYDKFLASPEQLAEQIGKDITLIHHDPHMRFTYDPSFVSQQIYTPTDKDIKLAKKYWKENNYMFRKVEVLPGNIGYLPFNVFVDDIEGSKPTLKAAFTFLANTSALIIDLRENMGGSPEMVSQIESYFFKEKTHMNDLINRSNKDTTFMFADPVKSDSLFLSMPLYILTSSHSFSGAEDFSYGMQVSKRAIIVGESTGGGAHPQMPFSVGQGYIAFIPFARSLNPISKTDWEGTGVIPDVKTSAINALNKAKELAFRHQLGATADQKEKNRLLYHINALLENETHKNHQLSKILPYTGSYGGLTIYMDKNRLFCKNNNSGGSISELKHLTNNLFILDKDAHIEFIKDQSGKFSEIRIFVNDGSIFEEKRNR